MAPFPRPKDCRQVGQTGRHAPRGPACGARGQGHATKLVTSSPDSDGLNAFALWVMVDPGPVGRGAGPTDGLGPWDRTESIVHLHSFGLEGFLVPVLVTLSVCRQRASLSGGRTDRQGETRVRVPFGYEWRPPSPAGMLNHGLHHLPPAYRFRLMRSLTARQMKGAVTVMTPNSAIVDDPRARVSWSGRRLSNTMWSWSSRDTRVPGGQTYGAIASNSSGWSTNPLDLRQEFITARSSST